MTYRPPGRSNRPGRANADNDVFEGLPVKQWGQSIAHVSLAPPKSENANSENDKWGEPPMPRDYQLLQPWTQQLLRLARSGKFGTKRKQDPDSMDDDKPEDDIGDEAKVNFEDRGYVAKKWKPVPEALLEPEHKHFEFLAKRRKGLPSLYAPELQNGPVIPMRKTKVQKTNAEGEITIYEVLVPEGQVLENELTSATEADLASIQPVSAVPGTVIEGVGIANEEGVVVAEHLKPALAPRRNRPPPKKKGGPGRGKKRVTFTNPDGTTYTTIVPNATKIVPQPGQIVTHVAKGEEAKADVTAEQVKANATARGDDGEGEGEGGDGEGEEGEEGSGSDEEGEHGDEDDDREEGELSDDDDAPGAGVTPVPAEKEAGVEPEAAPKTDDIAMENSQQPKPLEQNESPSKESRRRDMSSSPDLPLAKTSHSRTSSLVSPTVAAIEPDPFPAAPALEAIETRPTEAKDEVIEAPAAEVAEPEVATYDDGDEDLLGNLEKSLGGEPENEEA